MPKLQSRRHHHMKLVILLVFFIAGALAQYVPTNDTKLENGMKETHIVKAGTWNYYYYKNVVAKTDFRVRFAVSNNKKIQGVYSQLNKKPTDVCPREKDMYHANTVACGYLTKDLDGLQDVSFSLGYGGPYKYGFNSIYSPTGTYYIGVQGAMTEDRTYSVTFSPAAHQIASGLLIEIEINEIIENYEKLFSYTMDPLGSGALTVDRHRWIEDHSDVSMLTEKLSRSGMEEGSMVLQLRDRVRELEESAALFEADPSRYGLTDTEARRRVEMCAELRAVIGSIRSIEEDAEDTQLLSTDILMQRQRESLKAQDKDLDALGSAVSAQRTLGNTVNSEVRSHHVLLDEIDDDLTGTGVRLTRVRRSAARISQKDRSCYCCCIVILLIALIIILATTGWGCLLLFSVEQCSE